MSRVASHADARESAVIQSTQGAGEVAGRPTPNPPTSSLTGQPNHTPNPPTSLTNLKLNLNGTEPPAASSAPSAPSAAPSSAASGKTISTEEREKGLVKKSVWVAYVRALGAVAFTNMLACYSASQFGTFGSSWWLSAWAANQFGLSIGGYVTGYCLLSLLASVLIGLRAVVLTLASIRASRKMHDLAFSAVLFSPMSFFDTTPLGRILNRFQMDMQKVDVQLSSTIGSMMLYLFQLLGTLVLLCLSSPLILASVPFLGVIYYKVAAYYRASSRELQRLDSVSKSPVYAAFSEALAGAATIQAFGRAGEFCVANERKFDYNQRAGFVAIVANRWLSIRLEFISNLLLFLTALLAVLTCLFSSASGGGIGGGGDGAGAGLWGAGLGDWLGTGLGFTSGNAGLNASPRFCNHSPPASD